MFVPSCKDVAEDGSKKSLRLSGQFHYRPNIQIEDKGWPGRFCDIERKSLLSSAPHTKALPYLFAHSLFVRYNKELPDPKVFIISRPFELLNLKPRIPLPSEDIISIEFIANRAERICRWTIRMLKALLMPLSQFHLFRVRQSNAAYKRHIL